MQETREYISVADTAKLIRGTLKAEFPGAKFTVRSSSYSGGASIRVGWVDGPATNQVEGLISLYSGADFDGMIDLKTTHSSLLAYPDGTVKEVHFGADFVFAEREHSPEVYEKIARKICTEFGLEFKGISVSRWEHKGKVEVRPYLDQGKGQNPRLSANGPLTLQDQMFREMRVTSY